MQQLLLLLPVALPVIFWAAYHYQKDRHLPEPASHLALAFVLGLLALLLSRIMYAGLEPLGLRYDAYALADDNPLGLFIYAMLAIGPIEELAKLLPFVAVIIHLKEFDEPVDGIIYASFIGLGYAAAENLLYLGSLTPLQAAARGFASPVIHILFASIWAHWITKDWLTRRQIGSSLITGYVLAAAAHGLYDFLVMHKPVWELTIAATLIVTLWVWRLLVLRRLHRRAVRQSDGPQPRS